jgi:hypothetical protein
LPTYVRNKIAEFSTVKRAVSDLPAEKEVSVTSSEKKSRDKSQRVHEQKKSFAEGKKSSFFRRQNERYSS